MRAHPLAGAPLAVLLLLVGTAGAGPVYKWVDADGATHFSDRAPEGSDAREVRLHVPSFGGPATVSTLEASGGRDIRLYTTATCGYCKQARAYLKRRGLAFSEIDVETSAAGRADYARLKGRGVPIILVGNRRMDGFSAAGLEQVLREAGY